MRSRFAGSVLLALVGCAPSHGQEQGQAVLTDQRGPALKRFPSAQAFERFVRESRKPAGTATAYDATASMIVPAAPAEAMAAPSLAQAAAPANPGITNNQSAGVDEGGIVKQIGRYLVVLQDGRLFSIDLGDGDRGGMRLADRADVYRSAETAASWYDEMLVFGDRILVTAYNYRESASEITVLRLDSAGRIRREARYLMSSNDYYSTENYASRLVGDNLVFYAPHPLLWGGEDERFAWPTLRRADADGEAGKGEALIGPTDVTMPAGKVDYPVIHTVAVCPLRERIACRTTAFVGPEMRELYVSPSDAYLWIGAPAGLPWSIDYGNRRRNPGCAEGRHWNDPGEAAAMLYRLPLDGAPVGAVAVEGVPDDQFAFEAKDGHFRALLTRPRAGCAAPDAASPLALMDLPLSVFGPRVRRVAESAYAPLPAIAGGQIEKRFVGDWLVYGGRDGWSSMPAEGAAAQGSTLFAVPLAQPAKVARLALPHNAIRIERVGSDALVTGYRGAEGLSLSYVRLGAAPAIASTALLPDRFESENRSHAFNAAVQADGSGVMGIPTTLRIRRAGRGWSDSASSDLSFLAFGLDRKLAPAGELGLEGGKPAPGYACQVSCVDWYGNSRPIFTGGRIFALMGTELVEGTMREGRIVERGRVDLTRPVS